MNILTQGLGCPPSGLMTHGLISGAYFEVDVDTPLATGGFTQPIGIRETNIFPIISLIGNPFATNRQISSIIGSKQTITYPVTQVIGGQDQTQTPITQEIVSQQTLDDAEKRLDLSLIHI